MSVTTVFSQIANDWHLVRLTKDGLLNKNIQASLLALGWVEFQTKKHITHVSYYGGFSIPFDSKSYKKADHYEGSSEWYKDLASITLPNHKPGLITRILG